VSLQVANREIERQLGLQRAKEREDVLSRLRDGVGRVIDRSCSELSDRARAGFIAVGDLKAQTSVAKSRQSVAQALRLG
jgi:hypothetical protein